MKGKKRKMRKKTSCNCRESLFSGQKQCEDGEKKKKELNTRMVIWEEDPTD